MRNALLWLFAALGLSMLSQAALADGLIIVENPHPVPGHFAFAPLEVKYHRVDVAIDDQIAVTSVDQEFYNPGDARAEGTYLFPLPPNAHIDKFAMDINGKEAEAERRPAGSARRPQRRVIR